MWRGSSFVLLVLLELALSGSSCGFAPLPLAPARSLGMHRKVFHSGGSARHSRRVAQAPALKAAVEQPLFDGAVQLLIMLGSSAFPVTGLWACYKFVIQPNLENLLNAKIDKNKEELNANMDKNKEELNTNIGKVQQELKEDIGKVKEDIGKVDAKIDDSTKELSAKIDNSAKELREELKGDLKEAKWELREDLKEVKERLDKWTLSVYDKQSRHPSLDNKQEP
mmetsp:Transcript_18993/g.47942  ORF Transcript_18993/g.47942 Transcript_18993/m.47942 type:complete len:224 (-) Transcript_18993:127-798(-)